MKITDMHCHVLPGIDDGSRSMKMSIAMLRMAYDQGVNHLIATPHHSAQYHGYSIEQARELTARLREEAREKIDPRFRIYLGQEIMAIDGMIENLRAGKLLTMAGSDYVLIEFLPETDYMSIRRYTQEVLEEGYLPIIAHIERYTALRTEGRVEELAHYGAYLQMNYRSIIGGVFDKNARWCHKQLEEGLVSFLGTDMHSTGSRSPEIDKPMKYLNKKLDEDYVLDICRRNAEKVIRNERI